MSHFDTIVLETLNYEGGYSNNPNDRGGPTNFGITQNDLANFRGHGVTAEDVKNMSIEEAKTIYKTKYWDPCGLDSVINYKKALVIFDQGVLCGTKTSAKRAQSSINAIGKGKLLVDGVIGPKSIEAINQSDESQFCLEFIALTQHYFIDIVLRNQSQLVFLKGWINRSQNLLRDTLLKSNA